MTTHDWIADARADMRDPNVTYKEDATIRLPRALAALEAVLELHQPVPIYDECECVDPDPEDHVEVENVGRTCNYGYDACRACCGVEDDITGWWMHEECTNHTHGPDLPICETRRRIETALMGES